MTAGEQRLCKLDDIPLNSSKGFVVNHIALFAVRTDEMIYVYHNRCPHLGLALEWQSDQFLTHDKSLIQCSTHGALFEIANGDCIYGPCQGQRLASLPVSLNNGVVYIEMDNTHNASPES